MEEFWPNMPTEMETEALLLAMEKVKGTSMIEKCRNQARKDKETVHTLEVGNRSLKEKIVSLEGEMAQLEQAFSCFRRRQGRIYWNESRKEVIIKCRGF